MNSTFRWEMYLTPGLKGNKVPLLDGYSKGKGFENTNKLELLYKKLVNPVLPYLSRCDGIVIYEQTRGLPKALHTKLIELHPREFVAYGWIKETEPIMSFLNDYYTLFLTTGQLPPIEDRRRNVRQPVYFVELDHSKYNFTSKEELLAFCKALIPKYSAKCMETWFFKHVDFQPELFITDNSAELNHAINTASTYEAAEEARQAQASLQSMLGNTKFASKR